MVDRISDEDDDHRDNDAVEKNRHLQCSRRRAWTDFLEQQSASCRVFPGGKVDESAAFPDCRITISVVRADLSLRDRKQNPYQLGE